MRFDGQEYLSGLPYLPTRDLPNTEIKPTSHVSPALQTVLYPLSHLGRPNQVYWTSFNVFLAALSRCCEHQLYSWPVVLDLLSGWWNVQDSTAVFPGPRNDARLSCLWPLCWLPLLTPGPNICSGFYSFCFNQWCSNTLSVTFLCTDSCYRNHISDLLKTSPYFYRILYQQVMI